MVISFEGEYRIHCKQNSPQIRSHERNTSQFGLVASILLSKAQHFFRMILGGIIGRGCAVRKQFECSTFKWQSCQHICIQWDTSELTGVFRRLPVPFALIRDTGWEEDVREAPLILQ